MSSTPTSEWLCSACKADDGRLVPLQNVDGSMVCPECANIDATATSAVAHVDLSDITGQIVDPVQTLRSLDKDWATESDWYERTFMAKVEDMIKTNLTELYGTTANFNLQDGARLWFKRIRQTDAEARDLTRLSVSWNSKRLPYLVAEAVRLAVQESNLISIYNRLKGRRKAPSGAIQSYTKGDDRVFNMSVNELFAKSQEVLGVNDPARLTAVISLQNYDKMYCSELGIDLSFCDETLLSVSKALVILHNLVYATPEERLAVLHGKKAKKGWPEETFDQYKRIVDWDDIIRIADGLFHAQACAGVFPEVVRGWGSAAVALVSVASQIALGRAAANYTMVAEELSRHFGVHHQPVGRRTPELNRLILAWSTSIPEAGLPLPKLKPPKRSSKMGQGLQGWGSDKRRQVPASAIIPKSGRTIAENWQAIKRARLKRPSVIPYEEEMTLTRKMFLGPPVNAELALLLRQYTVSEAGSSRLTSPSLSDSISRGYRAATPLVDIEEEERPPLIRSPTLTSSKPISNKFDDVREWIEKGDESSDDDVSASTDDESSRPRLWKKRKTSDSRQNIGELPRPFAFSIGPTGFGIDRSEPAAVSPSLGEPSRSRLPTPSTTRGQSVDTTRSEGLTSASEACQMSRLPSSSTSVASASTSTESTSTASRSAYRATPLRSVESPAPSLISEGTVFSRAAELRALERGRADDNEHHGVLIRERSQFAYNDQRESKTPMHTKDRPDDTVIKAIQAWLDQPENAAHIPRLITAAQLKQDGVPLGGDPGDVAAYLISCGATRSTLETLLRLGFKPDDIPNHLVPQSTSAVNLDLYHYTERDAILGIGRVDETKDLYDTSMRLFFRGVGNDTLAETFLDEDEEMKARINDYYIKAYWDELDDPSPVRVAAKRVRKLRRGEKTSKSENMIQLIASGYDSSPDLFKDDPEGETDLIQRASLARLMHYEQRPPWDPYKVTATVPSIWYNDGIAELRLVPGFKNTIAAANDLAEQILELQKAEKAEQDIGDGARGVSENGTSV